MRVTSMFVPAKPLCIADPYLCPLIIIFPIKPLKHQKLRLEMLGTSMLRRSLKYLNLSGTFISHHILDAFGVV